MLGNAGRTGPAQGAAPSGFEIAVAMMTNIVPSFLYEAVGTEVVRKRQPSEQGCAHR